MTVEETRKVKINFTHEEREAMMKCADLMKQVFEHTLVRRGITFETNEGEYDLELWSMEASTILAQFANDGGIEDAIVIKPLT